MQKGLLIYMLLMSMTILSWANETNLVASAPSNVAVGERFRVAFQINARPSAFTPPAFSGFNVLSGPSQSSSTSVQITNGQMTQTVNFVYTFVLEALSEGNFTVPAASAVVDGNTYNSQPLTINVRRGTAPQPGQASPTPDAQQQVDRVSDQDLFVRATASKINPYQGEQVIIAYTLYTRVVVQQYSNEKTPSFQGFWAENITTPGQPQVRTEVIDGVSYHAAEILRFALFPQQTGQLTIEPLELKALVNVASQGRSRNIFDDFFGGHPFGTGQQIEQTIRSNQIVFNVRPLPAQNRPDAFTGIVGTNFDIQAALNTNELMVNDAANLTVTIRGNGNMRMVEQPQIKFPANLEVFDPNITDNINTSASGISGSRIFEFVLIPRTPGEFIIPEFNFVYFDPVQERYIMRTIPESVMQVGGDALAGNQNGIANRENIVILDTDIRFISTAPLNIIRAGQMFFRSNLYFVLMVAPVLIFAIFLVYWRNQIKLRGNEQLMKTRKAEKLARKRLQKAKKLMENGSEREFFDEISKALWGYLSDKLAIPVSILNKETVSGAFKAKRVTDELAQRFLIMLDDCEFARFAPGEKAIRMDEIYQKALDTIVIIEKDLRSKKDKS